MPLSKVSKIKNKPKRARSQPKVRRRSQRHSSSLTDTSSAVKSTRGRRAKQSAMVQILEATLTVTDNQTHDDALMVNAPTGTGDFLVYKETTISRNVARNRTAMLNHPHDKETLEVVAKVVGQDPKDVVSKNKKGKQDKADQNGEK